MKWDLLVLNDNLIMRWLLNPSFRGISHHLIKRFFIKPLIETLFWRTLHYPQMDLISIQNVVQTWWSVEIG